MTTLSSWTYLKQYEKTTIRNLTLLIQKSIWSAHYKNCRKEQPLIHNLSAIRVYQRSIFNKNHIYLFSRWFLSKSVVSNWNLGIAAYKKDCSESKHKNQFGLIFNDLIFRNTSKIQNSYVAICPIPEDFTIGITRKIGHFNLNDNVHLK